MNKTQLIKQAVVKIDIGKINSYLQEYPKSQTLRQIFGYRKRVLDSNSDEEIFKGSLSGGRENPYIALDIENKNLFF